MLHITVDADGKGVPAPNELKTTILFDAVLEHIPPLTPALERGPRETGSASLDSSNTIVRSASVVTRSPLNETGTVTDELGIADAVPMFHCAAKALPQKLNAMPKKIKRLRSNIMSNSLFKSGVLLHRSASDRRHDNH